MDIRWIKTRNWTAKVTALLRTGVRCRTVPPPIPPVASRLISGRATVDHNAMKDSGRRLLLLSDEDNVCVAAVEIDAGERVRVAGSDVVVTDRIPMGHKIAIRPIAAGEKVIKYGAPIGSATCDIAVGQHVHTHNLKSDYLPTVTRKGSCPTTEVS